MVTTQFQIIEKMLGRRLTKKEQNKVRRITHYEALAWAKEQSRKEGNIPGYGW